MPSTPSPKCTFCSQTRDCDRYDLWGGFLVGKHTRGGAFSGPEMTIAKYRDMKQIPVDICHDCLRKATLRGALPKMIISVVLGLILLGAMFLDKSPILFWGSIGAFVLGVIGAIVLAAMAYMAPNMSWPYEEEVRNFAKPTLKQRGLGDTFFTETEHAEQVGHDDYDSPNSAANMLRDMNRRQQ